MTTVKPFDVFHFVSFVVVALVGGLLAAGGKISPTIFAGMLTAWALPSAGGSLGRILGLLQPPGGPSSPGDGGSTLLAAPFAPPPPAPPAGPSSSSSSSTRGFAAMVAALYVSQLFGRMWRAIARAPFVGWEVVMVGAIAFSPFAWIALAACAGHITPADSAIIAAQTEEERQCVESNKPDRDAVDKCRANVRARSDAYWSAHFDGGSR